MGGNAAPSTTELTDVSTKPRHRRRDGYFWQLIILRIPVAIFAIAVIVYLARYVHKWQGALRRPEEADEPGPEPTRKDALEQSGLAFSMASVSLALAMWETAARLTPRYKYGPGSLEVITIFFDLLIIGLGIPGWMNFAMAEYYTSPGYPTPWRDDQNTAATMVVIFWVMHCVISIVGCSACCNCCGCGPDPPKSKKTAVTPAPIHPAQRQDLEQAGGTEPLPNYKQSTGLEEVEPTTILEDPPSYPEAVRLPPHAST